MTNLKDLYLEDGGIISYQSGAKIHGSCPICGGTKRFIINLALVNDGKDRGLGWCRCGQTDGSGCGVKGFALDYLKQVRNLGFLDACQVLDIDLDGPALPTRRRIRPRRNLASLKSQVGWQPAPAEWPEIVHDSAVWQEHALKLVNNCHTALLARPQALEWLAARGIRLELIKKHKLGFHAGQTAKGEAYQNSYRPLSSWGMIGDKKFVLPAGIVIPAFVAGHLVRLRIRTMGTVKKMAKYHLVKGSMPTSANNIILNPGQDIALVEESELDGLMIAGCCPDITVIPLGSANERPSLAAHVELKKKILILGALDRDTPKPGSRQKTWSEQAGAKASEWWIDQYNNFQPWMVPGLSLLADRKICKDPGEAFAAGGDLKRWIKEGIDLYTLPIKIFSCGGNFDKGDRGAFRPSVFDIVRFLIFWPEFLPRLKQVGLQEYAKSSLILTGLISAMNRDDTGIESLLPRLNRRTRMMVFDALGHGNSFDEWAATEYCKQLVEYICLLPDGVWGAEDLEDFFK